jgi:chromate transporter
MSDLFAIAWTFLRLSFLAVGGGIGVVPEMQRQVVGIHGWLTARQFVDGYALSQITPGPGMLVTAFIGYRVQGLLGASVAMAAMFLPTSLLTWIVAHRWERIQGRPWPQAVERALAPLA